MQIPEPVRRTSEIEDVTNLYFIHPVANRLTPLLARLGVAPNAVSIAGMLFGVSAGAAYFRYQDLRFAGAGFLLMIGWHVLDGVDGQLARLTRSQSETGKVLDGICDYVTFIAVYGSLAVRLSRHDGVLAWVLVIVAGICHAIQSAAYEVQRHEYDFWAWGRKSKDLLGSGAAAQPAASASPMSRLLRRLDRLYARVQFATVGFNIDFHERLASFVQSHPAQVAVIAQRYRAVFAKPVRRWSVLSANYRTLAIFVCAVLQIPAGYFLLEIVGFSAVLVVLSRRQRARHAWFLDAVWDLE